MVQQVEEVRKEKKIEKADNEKASGGGVAFGIISLSTGILSILSGVYFYIGLPLAVVAIIFGVLGLKKPDSRVLAIAGLTTGIIGVVFGFYYLLAWMVFVNMHPRYWRYY